ncbi:MAG: tetratricopeptide repeat protein [Candidatus Manganitrophaceae bacterium]|nr:MAG: tetratricopeptide repeat protein [Candidatus Manganitrophaceae bacterium]
MGKASQRKIGSKEPTRVLQEIDFPPPHFLTRPLSVFLLLAVLATLIYSNTFSVPFIFDDVPNIVENPRIKDLRNFLDLSGSRYIGYLSFALNYHFGNLSLFGYHLINLIIHIANGFLVYLLVRLLFQTPSISRGDWGETDRASWIALATALLFVVHPIQTQAVTYIVQRLASLATLFYLLSVVFYLKGRLPSADVRNKFFWCVLALLSTVLAMKTKEISFTLPIMLVLIEIVFFGTLDKERMVFLIPFLLTLLVIPFSRLDVVGSIEEGFAQQTTVLSRSEYLFTEFRVILTYLRLLLFPINQNLDYDYPVSHSSFEPSVLISLLFLLTLFAMSVYFVFVSSSTWLSLAGFGIFWFFLTLSVESSIIPIWDVIFEHRLYLPSVGFLMTLSMILFGGIRVKIRDKAAAILLLGVLLVFSVATYKRNIVWGEELTLWQDVVTKSPGSQRGHNNLGAFLSKKGELDKAAFHYSKALEINPRFAEAHHNLANTLAKQGRLEEAVQHYLQALQINPGLAQARERLVMLI